MRWGENVNACLRDGNVYRMVAGKFFVSLFALLIACSSVFGNCLPSSARVLALDGGGGELLDLPASEPVNSAFLEKFVPRKLRSFASLKVLPLYLTNGLCEWSSSPDGLKPDSVGDFRRGRLKFRVKVKVLRVLKNSNGDDVALVRIIDESAGIDANSLIFVKKESLGQISDDRYAISVSKMDDSGYYKRVGSLKMNFLSNFVEVIFYENGWSASHADQCVQAVFLKKDGSAYSSRIISGGINRYIVSTYKGLKALRIDGAWSGSGSCILEQRLFIYNKNGSINYTETVKEYSMVDDPAGSKAVSDIKSGKLDLIRLMI
jgi:hypothetical protein